MIVEAGNVLVALGQTGETVALLSKEKNRKCLVECLPVIVRKTTEFSSERFMFKLYVGLGLFLIL